MRFLGVDKRLLPVWPFKVDLDRGVPVATQQLDCAVDVRHDHRDVVHPFAALLEKTHEKAIRAGWLHELDLPTVRELEGLHPESGAIVRSRLVGTPAENIAVQAKRLLDAVNGDGYVIQARVLDLLKDRFC